ncbi:MAG: helix-turn-helix transcriptional regulator [Parasphingorhabdus sp.]
MTDLNRRFGNLVAAHRKRLKITQSRLAENTNLSEDMIARIEAGSTGSSFTTIEKLSEALNVDPAALFSADVATDATSRGDYQLLASKLSKLGDAELKWLTRIVDAALKSKG